MVTRAKPTAKGERIYTEEEFLNLPDEGKGYELWEGRLVEAMSPGSTHGRIAAKLTQKLLNYTDVHNNGTAYSNDTFFRLAPNVVVGPDVAFIAKGKVIEKPDDPLPFPPDLAIEVISPSDRSVNINAKIKKYLDAGTRLIWSVNPHLKEIAVYKQGVKHGTILGVDDELSGEDVLPGFKLKVNEIFEI